MHDPYPQCLQFCLLSVDFSIFLLGLMLKLVPSCLQPSPLLLIIPVCATSFSVFTLKCPNPYPQYLQFSPLPVGFSRPLSESCGLSLELTFLLLELGVLLLKLVVLLLELSVLLL